MDTVDREAFRRFLKGETTPAEPQLAAPEVDASEVAAPEQGASPRRRCTAISKNGSQCGKAPIRGGTVCRNHGGDLPQVKYKASQVLLQARDHAAAVLLDVVEWWRRDTCVECGFPKQDPSAAIRAAIAVLDRTGFGPSANINVTPSGTQPWLRWLDNDEWELLLALQSKGTERMESGAAPYAAGGIRKYIEIPGDKAVSLPNNDREPYALPAAVEDATYDELEMDESETEPVEPEPVDDENGGV